MFTTIGHEFRKLSLSRIRTILANPHHFLGPKINQREYCVIAQRRSGHHAVINWIRLNLNRPSLFANNCKPGFSPYTHNSSISLIKPPHYLEETLDDAQQHTLTAHPNSCLIYNFEDYSLRHVFQELSAIDRIVWIGRSKHIYPICVLRDPFNLLASKLRWSHGKKYAPSINEVFEAKNQWLEYARLYLQQQNDSRIIWVNFNSWFASERMREHYADRLNLDCSHRGLNIVAKYGPATWGDSFDELSFDEHAQQMKVFERWKNYRSNETFRTLVKDSELITLSKKIYDGFPDISEAINFAADL